MWWKWSRSDRLTKKKTTKTATAEAKEDGLDVAGHHGIVPKMHGNLSPQQKMSSLMKPLYPIWCAIE